MSPIIIVYVILKFKLFKLKWLAVIYKRNLAKGLVSDRNGIKHIEYEADI